MTRRISWWTGDANQMGAINDHADYIDHLQMRDASQVRCIQCGGSFPASRTNVTADGAVCDGCVHAAGR
jgi:hypothetical protein